VYNAPVPEDLEYALMGEALDIAREAGEAGEVPVGCVVEMGGHVIGRGANCTVREKDPTAHAEIVALRRAAAHAGDFRLEGARLFVTVEPCLMCLGAIMLARISAVFFGAPEPKFGAVSSRFALGEHDRLRKIAFQGGLRAAEAQELMSRFFQGLRRESAE
jgi:tRNA(adenine34) deaminase